MDLKDTLDDEDEIETEEEASAPSYTIDDIIEERCFLPRAELERALMRIVVKKNLILQGPPGTGKTWLAKKLAYALIGSKDRKLTRDRLRVVQFHPSLSYEDFVRGWRPSVGGQLSLIDGIFLETVQAAAAEPDRPFVLIIEEINRGNPAQIFGEMLTVLEDSKRSPDDAIELAYRRSDREKLSIPPNLHVIGTMNIADRSLALVDLALRRRFAFVTLEPQLNGLWKEWCTKRCGLSLDDVALIAARMRSLNRDIASDRSLGPQYRIGHSYVTPLDGAAIADARRWFTDIAQTEIIPLLEEYWFDAPIRLRQPPLGCWKRTRLMAKASEFRRVGRVPVRNIWLLFLYASGLAKFEGQYAAAAEHSPNFPELIARLLCFAVEKRLRRNLSRGYQARRSGSDPGTWAD